MEPYVKSFAKIGIEDLPTVGGKNASLGELTRIGMPVPSGFALTVEFYREFLNGNGLRDYISDQLVGLDINHVARLQKTGKNIRRRYWRQSFHHI